MLKKFLPTVIFITFITNSIVFSEDKKITEKKDTMTQDTITYKNKDGTVEIKAIITVMKYSSNIPFDYESQWGFLNKKHSKIIKKIEIYINNKKIFVPQSVYADLIDYHKMFSYITPDLREKGTYILILSGGDAGSSYLCRIYFDRSHYSVKRRIVEHAEIPDCCWEDTLYHFWDYPEP